MHGGNDKTQLYFQTKLQTNSGHISVPWSQAMKLEWQSAPHHSSSTRKSPSCNSLNESMGAEKNSLRTNDSPGQEFKRFISFFECQLNFSD